MTESNDNKITELCQFAYLYGADKCPQIAHPYTPFYYELFKDKVDSVKKVLEIGIGTANYMYHHPKHYIKGASLRMWRDFFPNAQIYGADILPEAMFEDDRIETFLCDERKNEDLIKLIEKTGSDIDIFIDDALHSRPVQVELCKTMMPMLKKDVIYIIEDVMQPCLMSRQLKEFDCFVPDLGELQKLPKNNIIIVKNYEK